MAAQQHIPLSDNHRRAVTTMFTMLDERLCELEQIGRGREVRSLLYQERNDLSAERRERLLQEIGRARDTIREIKEALSLQPTVHLLTRQVRAASSSLWEGLLETQSKRLRGYGNVPRALAQYLDPSLERLIDRLLSINSLAGGHKDDLASKASGRPARGRQAQRDEQAKSSGAPRERPAHPSDTTGTPSQFA